MIAFVLILLERSRRVRRWTDSPWRGDRPLFSNPAPSPRLTNNSRALRSRHSVTRHSSFSLHAQRPQRVGRQRSARPQTLVALIPDDRMTRFRSQNAIDFSMVITCSGQSVLSIGNLCGGGSIGRTVAVPAIAGRIVAALTIIGRIVSVLIVVRGPV